MMTRMRGPTGETSEKISDLAAQGKTAREIAGEIGVSLTRVYRAATRAGVELSSRRVPRKKSRDIV